MLTFKSLLFVIVLLNSTSISINSKISSNLKSTYTFNIPIGGSCNNKFCKKSSTKQVICRNEICSTDLYKAGEACSSHLECETKRCDNKICSSFPVPEGQSGEGEFCSTKSHCKSGYNCNTFYNKCNKQRELNQSCGINSDCKCPYTFEYKGRTHANRQCLNINTWMRTSECSK